MGNGVCVMHYRIAYFLRHGVPRAFRGTVGRRPVVLGPCLCLGFGFGFGLVLGSGPVRSALGSASLSLLELGGLNWLCFVFVIPWLCFFASSVHILALVGWLVGWCCVFFFDVTRPFPSVLCPGSYRL